MPAARRTTLLALSGLVALASLSPLGAPAHAEGLAPTTVDDVSSAYGNVDPVVVTLTAQDADGEVVAIRYTTGVDPEVPTGSSPLYDPEARPTLRHGERISYYAVDDTGTAEGPHTSPPAQIDTIAPTTTDDVPTSVTDADPVEVALRTQDAESGTSGASGAAVVHYTTGVDPEVPTVDSATYDPEARPRLSAGERISYFAVDRAGNVEAPHTSAALPSPPPVPPAPPALDYAVDTTGSTGGAPVAVALADLDGDRDLEVLTADSDSDRVTVSSRTSQGYYLSSTLGATGPRPRAVVAGDLDGDGDQDVATANLGDDTVTLLLRAGDGTYAATTVTGLGADPHGLAVADVDGDGDLDLVTANNGSDDVTVLTRTSADGAAPAYAVTTTAVRSTGTDPVAVAVGDLDGNGVPELVTANYGSRNVSILTRTSPVGAPAAYSSRTTANGTTGVNPTSVVVGDLRDERDADLEIATANGGSDTISLIAQTRSTSYASGVLARTGPNPSSLALGDLDGDGDLDLATANLDDNTVSVVTRNPFGASTGWTTTPVGGVGNNPIAVALGDLDGDGHPDLVTADYGSDDLTTLVNTADPADHLAPVSSDDVTTTWTPSRTATLRATDAGGSGVQAISYVVGPDPAHAPASAYLTYDPASPPALADGDRVRYFAVDADGNVERAHTSPAARVDATAPVTTDDVPVDFVSAGAVEVTLTGTDTGSGVQEIRYLVTGPGTGVPAGAPVVLTSVYDAAHKPVLVQGQSITYAATDVAGNTEVARTSRARIDTRAPVTTDSVGGYVNTDPLPVRLTSDDGSGAGGVSGVREVRYAVVPVGTPGPVAPTTPYDDAHPPTLTAGQRLAYAAVDGAGNVEVTRYSSAALIDTIAPVSTDDVPSAFVPTGSVAVTLSGTDAGGAGLGRIVYAVTDGAGPVVPTTPYTGPVTLAGGQSITYAATDRAGNAEAPHTSAVLRTDLVAPTTSDDVPDTTQTAPVPVTLRAVDAGSGVREVRYVVTTGPAVPGPLTSVYDAARPPLLLDGQRITYAATDRAGNTEAPRTSRPASVTTRFLGSPALGDTAISVGQTLTLRSLAFTPAVGRLSYQWVRLSGGTVVAIPGATAPSYTIPQSLVGERLGVRVTITAAGYGSQTATSDLTAPVRAVTIPGTTLAITGTRQINNTLTATTSLDGDGAATLTYLWERRDGQRWVVRSRSRSVALGGDDVGRPLRVLVLARKAGYLETTVGGGHDATDAIAPGTLCFRVPKIPGRCGQSFSLPVDATNISPRPGMKVDVDAAATYANYARPQLARSDVTVRYQWRVRKGGTVYPVGGDSPRLDDLLSRHNTPNGSVTPSINTVVWLTATISSPGYPTITLTSMQEDVCYNIGYQFKYGPCESQRTDGKHHPHD